MLATRNPATVRCYALRLTLALVLLAASLATMGMLTPMAQAAGATVLLPNIFVPGTPGVALTVLGQKVDAPKTVGVSITSGQITLATTGADATTPTPVIQQTGIDCSDSPDTPNGVLRVTTSAGAVASNTLADITFNHNLSPLDASPLDEDPDAGEFKHDEIVTESEPIAPVEILKLCMS